MGPVAHHRNGCSTSKERIQTHFEYNKLAAERKPSASGTGLKLSTGWVYHFTILEKLSAFRLAPPTSAPSISASESREWAFSGFTLPP